MASRECRVGGALCAGDGARLRAVGPSAQSSADIPEALRVPPELRLGPRAGEGRDTEGRRSAPASALEGPRGLIF